MTDQAPVRSVARAIDILLALTHGAQSLGSVAEATGLSKATAHRLLASLGHRQLVMQDARSGDYLLGPGCFNVADAVIRGFGGLGLIARPVLEQVREATRETVTLHVRAGTQRICVEELVSPQAVRYTAGVGAANPIHTGSAGKLLLAYTEPAELDALLDHLTLEPLTDATITDRAELESEIASIRRRGYAQSRGERVSGGAAMSTPVFSADGSVLAALSVLGPDGRLTDVRLRELRPLMVESAEEITGRLAALEGGDVHHEEGAVS